jgi:hypothetical protein
MANFTANVTTTSDTFQNWVDKTNILLDAYSTVIVTSAANSTGGVTTGNTFVNGFFSANTLIAVNSLRGGTVSGSGPLNITSNVSIGNSTVNAVVLTLGDLRLSNSTVSTTANLSGLYTNGVLSVSGNTTISGSAHAISGNAEFDSGTLFIDATNNRVGINNTAPGVALRVTGAVDISSTANVQNNANVGGTLGVVGAVATQNTLTVTGNTVLQKELLVTGNVFFVSNTFTINASGTVASTNTALRANVAVGNSTSRADVLLLNGNLTINTVTTYVVSNTDLGSNTTADLLVMSYPSTFKGAKILICANTSTKTQLSEVVVVNDGSNTVTSVYGTVVIPAGTANVFQATASINNANVEIFIKQVTINTGVKLSATLF